jgi:hypothetical protein
LAIIRPNDDTAAVEQTLVTGGFDNREHVGEQWPLPVECVQLAATKPVAPPSRENQCL